MKRALAILLFPVLCSAVEKPRPPHKFLDAANVSLQVLAASALTADLITTRRALAVPGTRELNPLAQSPGSLVALKVAGFAAGLSISYMLHQTGHHKAERFIPVVFGVPSGAAAVHNSQVSR